MFAGRGEAGTNRSQPTLIPFPKTYRPLGGIFKQSPALAFNTIGNEGLTEQTIRTALKDAFPLAEKPSASPPKDGLQLLMQAPGVSSSSPEAYKLLSDNQISISSNSCDGLLMGLRTLAQLAQGGSIPNCEIVDWPDISLRAAHLCYHLVRETLPYNAPNFGALIEQIDQLAALKYNAVLLELESMFPYKRHPLVSCQIAFTPEQMIAIRDRLKLHHMQIIPMVQCLGHAYNVLIHKEYASYREVAGTFQQYCPTNPKIADLYMEFVDEYLEAFPELRQWHMGGDESQQIGLCSRCKAKVERFGKSRVYVDHVSEIAHRLRERGLTPLLWSDMLEAHPEDLPRLPKDIKIVYWNYDVFNWTRPYAGGMFRRHGLQEIGAPAVRWESTHMELSVNYLGRLRGIEALIRRMYSEGCSEIIVTS
jgi:N-acetyl-beta-hexosaminidase